uniref:Uncharacterized protein n=1 Tax=Tetraselmis sp. GSL018 TaxID=582737 RepID=A0A061QR45_9CHLO
MFANSDFSDNTVFLQHRPCLSKMHSCPSSFEKIISNKLLGSFPGVQNSHSIIEYGKIGCNNKCRTTVSTVCL